MMQTENWLYWMGQERGERWQGAHGGSGGADEFNKAKDAAPEKERDTAGLAICIRPDPPAVRAREHQPPPSTPNKRFGSQRANWGKRRTKTNPIAWTATNTKAEPQISFVGISGGTMPRR